VFLDPFDVVPNDPMLKPELAHLGILRARAGDALEQAIRLSHQPLYPLLVGLARYVDHSSPLKIIPARGGGASGEPMCGFYFMKKGRKKPSAGVPPAEGKRRYYM